MINQDGDGEKEAFKDLSGEILEQKRPRCYKYLIFWRVLPESKDAELLESYSRIYGGLDVGVKLIRHILEDRERVYEARAAEESRIAALAAQVEEGRRRLYGK
jgi:hypothetical protein